MSVNEEMRKALDDMNDSVAQLGRTVDWSIRWLTVSAVLIVAAMLLSWLR